MTGGPAAVRVGVSGHRPNRLRNSDPPLLRAQVCAVLVSLRDGAQTTKDEAADTQAAAVELSVLSSLAEGSDRIVAEVGLELGFELDVPLPMPVEDYERDFETEASRAEFHALLARARQVTELPGDAGRPLAYRAAGERVLAECNVLLVIFDGEPAAGPGGTPEMVDLAWHIGRPVICIDAAAPHAIHFADATDPLGALCSFARELVQV